MHGAGDTVSTTASFVADYLNAVIPKRVYGLEYNAQGHNYSYSSLIGYCEDSASEYGGITNRTLLIGDSLGGYLSAQLAAKYKCYCILGVPVTNAGNIDGLFTKTYSPWRWYYQPSNYVTLNATQLATHNAHYEEPRTATTGYDPKTHVTVIYSRTDTMLDYNEIVSYWQGNCSGLYNIQAAGHGNWTTTWESYSSYVMSAYNRYLTDMFETWWEEQNA